MRAARCAPGSYSPSSPETRHSHGGSFAISGGLSRRLPCSIAMTDAAASRVEGVSELLELRVDERRGTLFFGRGDDGLVIVVPAGDRGVIDEVAERFDVRIGVSDPASYDGFAAALDQARVARDRGARPGDGLRRPSHARVCSRR